MVETGLGAVGFVVATLKFQNKIKTTVNKRKYFFGRVVVLIVGVGAVGLTLEVTGFVDCAVAPPTLRLGVAVVGLEEILGQKIISLGEKYRPAGFLYVMRLACCVKRLACCVMRLACCVIGGYTGII